MKMFSVLLAFFSAFSLACGDGKDGANCRSKPVPICSEEYDLPRRCGYESVEVSDVSWQKVDEFKWALGEGRVKQKTHFALDALIRYAAVRLKQRGHKKKAQKLLLEWNNNFRENFFLIGRDIGDHAPLSQWLSEQYAMIEFILGKNICEWTRLSDIQVINHALPLVIFCTDNVDLEEYTKHFVPLMGVVSFWGSYFTCLGFTWETWALGLFCGPVSMGVEYLVESYVAPEMSKLSWSISCQ